MTLRAVLSALVLPVALAAQTSGKSSDSGHLQPGDRLVVRVMGDTSRTDTLMVSDAGTVVLPRLGVVHVTALSFAELPDTLRARYGEYLRYPNVDVVALRRVVVNGEVRRPDVYFVDLATKLPDVIARAGGLTDYGNPNDVWISRNGDRIPVRDWETTTMAVGNLGSGDRIVVGRRSWLAVNFLPAVSTAAVVTSILISLLRR